MSSWEDNIALKNASPCTPSAIGTAREYVDQDDSQVAWASFSEKTIEELTALDPYALPDTQDREGYYGPNHFNYWASGLVDYHIIKNWMDDNSTPLNDYMDFGCASGRVLRHFHAQSNGIKVVGCDINRQHVDWCNEHLPLGISVFQNTSLPYLPLKDDSLDLITAFSVFTHIEAFDTSWLKELERVLRPGGIAWVTIHGDRTWADIEPSWPLHNALTTHPDYVKYADQKTIPEDRLIYRWHSDQSYSANVFYTYEYIRKHWGRFFDVVDIFPASPHFQDVVVLRKHT